MKDHPLPHVTLAGDLTGDYVVTERGHDGTLVLAPETPHEASLRRRGLEPATLAELEAEHGPLTLPPDGEG